MKYLKNKLIKKLKLPKDSILILFRNPKEFRYFEIEKINPNHKLILWGKLKKKYIKTSNKIMIGKIILPVLLLMSIDMKYIIDNMQPILTSFILVEVYLFACKMEGLIKCLLELKVGLVQEKLLI